MQVVVIDVPEVPEFALINGEVVRHSGRRWIDEGCLSIPGYRGELFRSVHVTVRGLDRHGRPIRIRAVDDLLAQALEHEIDHTHGLLYIDRIDGEHHLHKVSRGEGDEEPAVPVTYDRNAVRPAPPPGRRRGRPPLVVKTSARRQSVAEAHSRARRTVPRIG